MRFIEVFQKEDYQPLDRGAAFPQFYENGDRYKWWNPMDFTYRYWQNFIQWSEIEFRFKMPEDLLSETLMMGGEL